MKDISKKRYYGERVSNINPKMDLETLKGHFLSVYEEFEEHIFINNFKNADIYVYSMTKIENIWPIKDNIGFYKEVDLFTVIELLYDHIRVYTTESIYPFKKKGLDAEATRRNKSIYRAQINIILKHYNGGYELSEDGEILKILPLGFETLTEDVVETNDPKNIDSRLKYAITKFSRYNSSIDEKKDAVRTLADVLEYLGKFGIKLDNKDDSDLFRIINKFDIRHHDRKQQGCYDKEVWYDWMFYTFLASIHVLLKLNIEKFDLKTL